MLSIMRRHSQSTIIKVLLLMVVVSFLIGFGAFAYVQRSMKRQGKDLSGEGGKKTWVAKVNGHAINANMLIQAMRNLEENYKEMLGEMAATYLNQMDLPGAALNLLINEQVLGIVAANLGLVVTDTELADAIYRIPAFQANGRFDRKRYVAALGRAKLSPQDFEEEQRRDMVAQKLRNLVFSTVKISDAELRDEYNSREDKANLKFIKLIAPKDEGEIELTAEQVETYFEANKAKFKVPESRKINYLDLSLEDFAKDVTLSETEIEKYFEDNRESQFTQPEEIHARHILIQPAGGEEGVDKISDEAKQAAKAKTESLLKEIKNGADFAELAAANSTDPGSKDKGGDLGWFGKGKMVEAFENAAFALKPGETSEVVETPYGYHIIQVLDKREAKVFTLDEARPKIEPVLKQQKAKAAAEAKAKELRELCKPGEDLLAFGTSRGLKVATSSPFSAHEPVPGIPQGMKLSQQAFEMEEKQISEPIDLEKDIYLIQVSEIIPEHDPALTEVEDKEKEDLRRKIVQDKLIAKGEQYIAALKAGSTLEQVAAKEKLNVQETGLFARGATSIPKIGMSPELVGAAFSSASPSPILSKPYPSGNGVVVCVIQERQTPTEAQFQAKKDEIKQELVQRKGQLTLQAWTEQAEKKIKIERNEQLLDALRGRTKKQKQS